MNYRIGSNWNDVNELRALAIFKMLKEQGFPRGEQMSCCKAISNITGLSSGSLSAKVCNYKSVAGINRHSNASLKTKEIYEKYGHLKAGDIEKLIKEKKF